MRRVNFSTNGVKGAQAEAFALLVDDPGQQMKNFTEFKKIFFPQNLHIPNLYFVAEKRNMLGLQKTKQNERKQKKQQPFVIFNITFSTKTRNENW